MKKDIVCYCRGIDRATIQNAIEKHHAKSINDIQWATGACIDKKCSENHPQGCGCEGEIEAMILAYHGHISGPKCSCGACS